MFYDQYIQLCNGINKAPSTVALELGFKKSTVTAWKNGSKPTDANIQKIADYFGVTRIELLGEAASAAPESGALSPADRRLLDAYHQATPELQAAVRRVLGMGENAVTERSARQRDSVEES